MHSLARRCITTIDAWPPPAARAAAVGLLLAWSLLGYFAVRAGLLSSGPGQRQFTDLYERFQDVSAMLHNHDLYALRPRGASLNTNPPVVVLMMLPFDLLGRSGGAIAWSALTVASVAAVAMICLRKLSGLSVTTSALVSCAIAPGAALVLSDPYRVVLLVGQVRTVLLLLVVADLFVISPRRRGILIGFAAAISLTPLVFLLLVGMSAGRRAVFRCLAAAAAFSLVGVLAGARAWWRFYAVLLPTGQQLHRVLRHRSASDAGQSNLRSVFARAPLAHLPVHALLLDLTIVAITIGGVWVVVRLWKSDLPVTAVMSLGFLVTIIEPESWVHYWVWALLGPFAAWELVRWRRGAAWGTLLFLVPMLPLSRIVAAHLGLIEQLASFYVLGALAFLGLVAVLPFRDGVRPTQLETTLTPPADI